MVVSIWQMTAPPWWWQTHVFLLFSQLGPDTKVTSHLILFLTQEKATAELLILTFYADFMCQFLPVARKFPLLSFLLQHGPSLIPLFRERKTQGHQVTNTDLFCKYHVATVLQFHWNFSQRMQFNKKFHMSPLITDERSEYPIEASSFSCTDVKAGKYVWCSCNLGFSHSLLLFSLKWSCWAFS